MPSKKKKYNARFPVGRIKKIMQSDEEVGKVAQAVPIIISRTLELFVESLLTKTLKITNSRNAKTLSTSHMKQCIMSEQRFDFLRELVRNIPDISVAEEAANYIEEDNHSSPDDPYGDSDTPFDLSMPSTSAVRSSLTRHHQQGMATNGQNGGHGHEYPRNYLKRSVSSNANSVIMHTTSLANATGVGYSSTECLPPKLSRSESTPVPPPPPTHPQQQTSTLPPASSHPRLKHQSFSMPSSCISSNNNKPNNFPQQLRPPSQQTAIPAPIVSIDYCNKPVVKIDYSNLPQITSDAATSAPMSAPASMSSNASAFNFTAEPVINIDLSNIVATVGGTNTKSSTPPVATISIGTTPQQSRNSKTAMAEPFDSSSANVKPAATMTTSTVVNSGNSSCLELDEDYDNI